MPFYHTQTTCSYSRYKHSNVSFHSRGYRYRIWHRYEGRTRERQAMEGGYRILDSVSLSLEPLIATCGWLTILVSFSLDSFVSILIQYHLLPSQTI